MAIRIGKKFKSGRIGKKMRRVATIGGRGGIVYGKSLQGAGAVATAVGVPELGVPVMLAGKGLKWVVVLQKKQVKVNQCLK